MKYFKNYKNIIIICILVFFILFPLYNYDSYENYSNIQESQSFGKNIIKNVEKKKKSIYESRNQKYLIYSDKSDLQTIKLYKKGPDYWLTLNDQIQFHNKEYRISHSMQCDVAMNKYKPQNILILGGGDGLLASCVLKYPFVKSVTMVEIDKNMIKMLEKSPLMNSITNNVVNNPKLKIVVEDANKFVFEYQNSSKYDFDLILEDIEWDFTKQSVENIDVDVDVDNYEYFKKLTTMGKVISLTFSDEEDEDSEFYEDFPIFTKYYYDAIKKYDKPTFIEYKENMNELMNELKNDYVNFMDKFKINNFLKYSKIFISSQFYEQEFGFEMYMIIEN